MRLGGRRTPNSEPRPEWNFPHRTHVFNGSSCGTKFTLLPEQSDGRQGLNSGKYRPHIVIGPESQRVEIREGNRFTENYLGVMFVGGPDTMEPGDAADVKLALIYFPDYPYEEVEPGVTFTVRQGPSIVGYGVIQSR